MSKERRGDRSRSPPNKIYTLGGTQLRGSTKSELSTKYDIPDEDLSLVPYTKPYKIWSHQKPMNVPIATYTAHVSSKCRPVVCLADAGKLCFSQGSRINLSKLGECNTDGSVSKVKTFKDKFNFITDLFGSLDGSLVALFNRGGFKVTFPDFTVESKFQWHSSHEVSIGFKVGGEEFSIVFPQNNPHHLPRVYTPGDTFYVARGCVYPGLTVYLIKRYIIVSVYGLKLVYLNTRSMTLGSFDAPSISLTESP